MKQFCKAKSVRLYRKFVRETFRILTRYNIFFTLILPFFGFFVKHIAFNRIRRKLICRLRKICDNLQPARIYAYILFPEFLCLFL